MPRTTRRCRRRPGGRPASDSSSRSGRSASGTLTEYRIRPVANSTTLGTPMPTARESGPRTASMASTSWSSSASASEVSVLTTCGSPGSPRSTAAAATLVPPTSTPMNWPASTPARSYPLAVPGQLVGSWDGRLGAGGLARRRAVGGARVTLARVELAVGRSQQFLRIRPESPRRCPRMPIPRAGRCHHGSDARCAAPRARPRRRGSPGSRTANSSPPSRNAMSVPRISPRRCPTTESTRSPAACP